METYTVETLPEEEFQRFFSWLPSRVQLLVKSGMCDWKEVLPEWFDKYRQQYA